MGRRPCLGSGQLRLIQEIKNRLSIFFGSHAHGSAGAESDIDFIVVLNKDKAAGSYREKMRSTVAVRKLLTDINRQVALDVLDYSKKEWQALVESKNSFSRDILEKGFTLQ